MSAFIIAVAIFSCHLERMKSKLIDKGGKGRRKRKKKKRGKRTPKSRNAFLRDAARSGTTAGLKEMIKKDKRQFPRNRSIVVLGERRAKPDSN